MVPAGNFGKSTFQLWAAIALLWGWGMGLLIVILPLYESSGSIKKLLSGETKKKAKSMSALPVEGTDAEAKTEETNGNSSI